LLTQTIDNNKEHIIAVLVSREQLIIYCQMLPRALWYRKRVQVARSTVLRHRSSSALIAIGYVAFDVSAQAFLVIAQRNKLESFGFSWVRSVKCCINKPKELYAKVVVFWDH
jgi:hypothetical protein